MAQLVSKLVQSAKHTIILIQYTPAYQTRTYIDFPSVPEALDGYFLANINILILCRSFNFLIAVVKLYEHKLKELNPTIPQITYDIKDLHNYIDSVHDMCALM